jgi:23S rRNA (guanosine2251-2'-O)-methyltransferase
VGSRASRPGDRADVTLEQDVDSGMSGRLIIGFHAVLSRIRQNARGIQEIYLDQARSDPRAQDLLRLAEGHQVRVIRVAGNRLDGLTRGARHQGVAALAETAREVPDLDEILARLQEPALLLVLDGVQDPRNLGACLRVADAFGAHAVIAPKDRACPLTETAAKAASGAAETVPYVVVTNLARTLSELKERGIWVVGATEDAPEDLTAVRLDGALAWVLGAEAKGLRRLTREECDVLARIPTAGTVESLNVSVAAGICLFETRRQRAPK